MKLKILLCILSTVFVLCFSRSGQADSAGTEKWTIPFGEFGPSLPSIDYEGNIYVIWNNTIFSYKPDGMLNWQFATDFSLWGLMIGEGANLYALAKTSDGSQVIALSLAGELQWSYTVEKDEERIYSFAVGPEHSIYLAQRSAKLSKLDSSGTLLWTTQIGDSEQVSYVGQPLVAQDGTVYVKNDNKIHAVDTTGVLKWVYANPSYLDLEGVSAIGNDGTIFQALEEGTLLAINPNGTLKWQYLAAEFDRGDETNVSWDHIESSPVIAEDGTVYYSGSYTGIHGISAQGQLNVNIKYAADSISIGNDGVLYLDNFFAVSAINPDGTERWSYSTNQGYAAIWDFDLVTTNRGVNGEVYVSTMTDLIAINSDSGIIANSSWARHGGNARNNWSTVSHRVPDDSDGDGLFDEDELNHLNTDPHNFDTDFDGVADNIEIERASDPTNSLSFPGSEGTLKWRYFVGEKFRTESPRLLSNQRVYIESRNARYVFSKEGQLTWSDNFYNRYQNTFTSLYDSPYIYVTTNGISAYVLAEDKMESDQNSTKQLLLYETADDSSTAAFLDTNNIEQSPEMVEKQWSAPCSFPSEPAIHANGTVYFSCTGTVLYAYNNKSGTLHWSLDLTETPSTRSSSYWIWSSPALGVDGTIYVASKYGELYAVNPDGSIKWVFNTESAIHASPVVDSDGTVYLGAINGVFYAVNPDGSLKWSFTTENAIIGSAAIGADGVIYVGSMDSYMYALSSTGELRWKYRTGNPIGSSPAIADDGTVYFGSQDGYVYALYSTSQGLMDSTWPKYAKDNSLSSFLAWEDLPEGDVDNDGVINEHDNCPLTANPDQYNNDGDLAGDACDDDDDNDGIDDIADAYPFVSIGGLPDNDGDGAPDTCDVICIASGMQADEDDDNDGVSDTEDFFPFDAKRFRAYAAYSDVNGDGRSDILWRSNTKGWNFLWAMEGLVPTISPINVVPEAAWQMATLSDFDGDRKTDIFWRNELTGENVIYLMDGSGIKTKKPLNYATPGVWELKSSGDFNGDGKEDVLWRNTETKNTWAFLMDGDKIAGYSPLLRVTNPDFRIIATGNVDGDEDDDVIWINTYRAVFVWLLNDAKMESVYRLTVLHENWVVAGFADMDGDGTDDLITRNEENGLVWVYFLNDGQIREGAQLYQVENLNWQLVHTGDYNGDGKADIFWRNVESGENIVHLMDGATIAAKGVLRTLDNSWVAAQ
ncbi:Outer membrane protein assembly factor BamB, contains PQQ-like beta-propeller repeat [Marisediminitalea aggregata]|uniref:Outer membrane protein assembly factor BamB, contains PQQ-like beta-propeller repeat n=1 Tax=Marisediminitalea aggregata TaxID=634436 RepID=A0A1M5SWR5_9ALTE|nr:PQQ-binding-like beta-propeller repeat protein [Marisediminitalea aggregata]SHH42922.1 Outer membrane protein assembly factor BamB, contains PQQ-like beta-propeller repeat [Marisediminitalea aggregata]